jgi:hypothetical protein
MWVRRGVPPEMIRKTICINSMSLCINSFLVLSLKGKRFASVGGSHATRPPGRACDTRPMWTHQTDQRIPHLIPVFVSLSLISLSLFIRFPIAHPLLFKSTLLAGGSQSGCRLIPCAAAHRLASSSPVVPRISARSCFAMSSLTSALRSRHPPLLPRIAQVWWRGFWLLAFLAVAAQAVELALVRCSAVAARPGRRCCEQWSPELRMKNE